jgi:hypothetical protein
MAPAAARKPRGRPRKVVAVNGDDGSTSDHPPVSESHAQKPLPLVVVKRLTEEDVALAVGALGSRQAGETVQSAFPGDDQQFGEELHHADEDDHFGEHVILGCSTGGL